MDFLKAILFLRRKIVHFRKDTLLISYYSLFSCAGKGFLQENYVVIWFPQNSSSHVANPAPDLHELLYTKVRTVFASKRFQPPWLSLSDRTNGRR
jgi:hypothetical protein